MSTSRPKLYPYLGAKAHLFYDPFHPKSSQKSSEATALKPLSTHTRSISPKTLLISSESSVNALQRKIQQIKVRSQDFDTKYGQRFTLPALNYTKSDRQETIMSQITAEQQENPSIDALHSINHIDTHINITNYTATSNSEIKVKKSFRIRGTAPLNKSNRTSASKNNKTEGSNNPRLDKKVSTTSLDEGEKDFWDTKGCELHRMCFNIPSQARAKLPLLIVHFEGIIGSCLLQTKDRSNEIQKIMSNKNQLEEYFFVRKDVKNELKHLARSFLIAIIFPCANDKYKVAMKHLINNKYTFDAAYYKTGDYSSTNKIGAYILDYSIVACDFKIKSTHKKVVIMLPFNLNSEIIQRDFLQEDNWSEEKRPKLSDKSCFLHFFPKLKTKLENLKVVCIPSFVLQEKNEQYSNLVKTEFSPIAKLAIQLLKDIDKENKNQKNQLQKRGTEEISSATPTLEENISYNSKQEQCAQSGSPQEIISEPLVSEVNSAVTKENSSLRILSLESLFEELEKLRQFSIKLRRFEAVKEMNNVIKGQSVTTFDLSSMRQKMIEDMASVQRTKGNSRGGGDTGRVSLVGAVAGLFNNNGHLFKLYEKDSFYTNRKGAKVISDIIKYLDQKKEEMESNKESEKEEEKYEDTVENEADREAQDEVIFENEEEKGEEEYKKDEISNIKESYPLKDITNKEKKKQSKKQKMKIRTRESLKGEEEFSLVNKERILEEENDMLGILLIKHLAPIIKLYMEI